MIIYWNVRYKILRYAAINEIEIKREHYSWKSIVWPGVVMGSTPKCIFKVSKKLILLGFLGTFVL